MHELVLIINLYQPKRWSNLFFKSLLLYMRGSNKIFHTKCHHFFRYHLNILKYFATTSPMKMHLSWIFGLAKDHKPIFLSTFLSKGPYCICIVPCAHQKRQTVLVKQNIYISIVLSWSRLYNTKKPARVADKTGGGEFCWDQPECDSSGSMARYPQPK